MPVWDLVIWEIATGRERAVFPYLAEHLNVSTDFFAVASDGRMLAFLDNSERLPVDVRTWREGIEGEKVPCQAYNATEGLPRVKIWDVPEGKTLKTINGGAPLVFSPDGKTLISGARDWHDPTAKVWDTATGRKRFQFATGSPWIKPLTFSPDGKFLAIGTTGRQELYELASGRKWSVEASGNYCWEAPVFSSDGKLLFPGGLPRIDQQSRRAGGYSCYKVGKLSPNRLVLESEDLAISPDGLRYAAIGGERGSGGSVIVSLHDLPSLRESSEFAVAGLVGTEFSPGGRWLALFIGRRAVFATANTPYLAEVRLFDLVKKSPVMLTFSPRARAWGDYGWKFSPDGKLVAIHYRAASDVSGREVSDDVDRPITVELWKIQPD